MKTEKNTNSFIIKIIIITLFILLLLFSYGIIQESKLNYLLYRILNNFNSPLKNMSFLGHKLVFPPYFIYNFIAILAILVAFYKFFLPKNILKPFPGPSKNKNKKKEVKSRIFTNNKLIVCVLLILLSYLFFIWFFLAGKLFLAQLFLFLIILVSLSIAALILDKKNNAGVFALNYLTTTELKILTIYSLLILILYVFDLKSWKYSYIEDEWPFFDFIKGVLNNFTKINFFSSSGVYGYHPVLSSVWQSIIMFLTDKGIYGFKLSSAIIIPLSIIPFYLWNKMVFNKTVAIIATVIFSFSNAMLGFAHIGYNNIQSIFFYVSVLCCLEIAIRKRSFFWLFITALFMGLGFYTFYASRIIIIIFILYLLLHPERKQINKNHVIFSLIVFTLIILPLLIEKDFIKKIIVQSVISGSEIKNTNERIIYVILNFIHSFFAFLYKYNNTHYIIDGLVDIFSAIGVLSGFIWIIYYLKNDWRAKFLSLTYIIFVFFIGAMQQYDYPVNTRLYFFVPVLSTIAGIGITNLSLLSIYFSKKRIFHYLILSIFCVIIVSNNIFTFYKKMPEKFHFFNQAYIIKILQEYKNKEKILITGNISGLNRVIMFYGLENKLTYADINNFVHFLKQGKIKNKILIFDNDTAARIWGIEKLVKPGCFLTNNIDGKIILYFYDFSANNGHYDKFYELWETGEMRYVE